MLDDAASAVAVDVGNDVAVDVAVSVLMILLSFFFDDSALIVIVESIGWHL